MDQKDSKAKQDSSTGTISSPRTRRRKTGIFAALGVIVAMLASLMIIQPAQATGSTITGIVAGSGDFDKNEQDFDILLQAVLAADLAGTLDTAGLDVTVFAPKDWAFIQLARDLGYGGWDEAGVWNFLVGALTEMGGGDPIPVLTDILLYHVSPGQQSLDQVLASSSIATLQGQSLRVNGNMLVDSTDALANPKLLNWQADIAASNGTIHVIDRVLVPGEEKLPTITDIVAASGGDFDKDEQDFDILLNAVLAAGLEGVLADPSADLTVLAPKDWAFIQLARELGYGGWDEEGSFNFLVAALTELGGGDPIPVLTDVLTYHVLPGTQTFDSITSQTSLTTLLGAPLGVHGTTFLDNDPGLTDSRLINWQSDIGASNGIIQVLDRVLIPINITGGAAS